MPVEPGAVWATVGRVTTAPGGSSSYYGGFGVIPTRSHQGQILAPQNARGAIW